jgi:hypothetical protein
MANEVPPNRACEVWFAQLFSAIDIFINLRCDLGEVLKPAFCEVSVSQINELANIIN